MFWSLGKAINWYRLRRDMIRPISPQAVAESVCWCGVMMWGLHPPQVQDFHAACVSPHFSDCNAYVKVRLSCLDDPWWPQKVNQRCRNSIDKYRQIQNSPFNLSLSLSLSGYLRSDSCDLEISTEPCRKCHVCKVPVAFKVAPPANFTRAPQAGLIFVT